MRTAHLIITYTNPTQTERMIKRMMHPDFDFYIHVDKKVDIGPHLYLKELGNVYFIKNRVDVKWAGFNTVKATFNGIREIHQRNIKYNFINLLSGQDYPLVSAQELACFFNKHEGDAEFVSYVDYDDLSHGKQWRYRNYHLNNYSFKGHYRLELLMNRILPKRKNPKGYHAYGASMFWMLSPEAAIYVVNTVENSRKLQLFFLLSWASDEFLFQTVLMNSSFRSKIVNRNYRYYDWSEKKSHPKVLRAEDFDNIKNSGMLFGRKFDVMKDAEILDLIDATCQLK